MRSLILIFIFIFGQLSMAGGPNLTRRGFILGSIATVTYITGGTTVKILNSEIPLTAADAEAQLKQWCEGFVTLAMQNHRKWLDQHTDEHGYVKLYGVPQRHGSWHTVDIEVEKGWKMPAQVRAIDSALLEKLQKYFADNQRPTIEEVDAAVKLLSPPEEQVEYGSPTNNSEKSEFVVVI